MTTSNRKLLFLVPGLQPGERREEFANRAIAAARGAGVLVPSSTDGKDSRLAPRIDESNPDHHLWNNNGTWWFHCTVHGADYTSRRIRRSLGTRDVGEARRRRDEILRQEGGKEQ